LGLPRAIIKSHPKEKIGRDPGLGELPKIWGFPCDISVTGKFLKKTGQAGPERQWAGPKNFNQCRVLTCW